MEIDPRLSEGMLDLDWEGLTDHLLSVFVQNRMPGAFLQGYVQQVHRHPSLLDRQAKNDLAFQTVEFRLKGIALSLIHIGKERLSEPTIVGPSGGSCSNGDLLHGTLLHSRCMPSRRRLLHYLSGFNGSL